MWGGGTRGQTAHGVAPAVAAKFWRPLVQLRPKLVPLCAKMRVKFVTCGDQFTLAVMVDGGVSATRSRARGQRGLTRRPRARRSAGGAPAARGSWASVGCRTQTSR